MSGTVDDLFNQLEDGTVVPSDACLDICMIRWGDLPLMSPGMLCGFLYGEDALARFRNRKARGST